MKIVVGVVVYNEEEKITRVIKRFSSGLGDEIIVVDDCSTDKSLDNILKAIKSKRGIRFKIIRHNKNMGVGASIRDVINYGIKYKFDICVIMAGNGKDDPAEIPKLTRPIIEKDYDYIQGSRFLKGGSYKHLPLFRQFLIRGFTLIFSAVAWRKLTDTSNGFKAYKLSIFADKRININQAWLNSYELETYLHYKVATLGYKMKEIAVSKDYLPYVKNYSKMRPIIDWWKFFRPLILLKFGLKR